MHPPRRALVPSLVLLRVGVFPATGSLPRRRGALLPHLSPLPHHEAREAVYFLWHFPSTPLERHRPGRLSGTLLFGVRTFLCPSAQPDLPHEAGCRSRRPVSADRQRPSGPAANYSIIEACGQETDGCGPYSSEVKAWRFGSRLSLALFLPSEYALANIQSGLAGVSCARFSYLVVKKIYHCARYICRRIPANTYRWPGEGKSASMKTRLGRAVMTFLVSTSLAMPAQQAAPSPASQAGTASGNSDITPQPSSPESLSTPKPTDKNPPEISPQDRDLHHGR